MFFLIDENLPTSVGDVFRQLGYSVQCVSDSDELRSKPDEALFSFALEKRAVIVTRDVRFASLTRFPLQNLGGMMLLRFPHDMSIDALCAETQRLLAPLQDRDYLQLIIVEPGSIRLRKLGEL